MEVDSIGEFLLFKKGVHVTTIKDHTDAESCLEYLESHTIIEARAKYTKRSKIQSVIEEHGFVENDYGWLEKLPCFNHS